MEDLQVRKLIEKYLKGKATIEETAFLESWYLKQATAYKRPDQQMIDENEAHVLKALESRFVEKKKVLSWPRITVAAASILIVIVAYIANSTFTITNNNTIAQPNSTITPGADGATLTLSNGKNILIRDALIGNIASESGMKISKTEDGLIFYELTDQGATNIGYNTLTTSRGEQAQVRLPDGSIVFLNAASSLKYPTSFAKTPDRSVFLTGEAYFEIAKNKTQPFIVATDKQNVEVLGTHFNINAYGDETAVKTTLLEGSLKVSPIGSMRSESVILRPGQQSLVNKRRIQVATVDVEEAMAWQKGYFSFYDEDISSIMRKLSRWYNIDVEYRGKPPEVGFNARINKYSEIKDVLEILEKSKVVHFKMEGRKVIVSK